MVPPPRPPGNKHPPWPAALPPGVGPGLCPGGEKTGDRSPVPCPVLSFVQECAAWTRRRAERLATTWSHSSTLLCSQACRGAPTTTPLLVMQTHLAQAPWPHASGGSPIAHPPERVHCLRGADEAGKGSSAYVSRDRGDGHSTESGRPHLSP